MCIEFDYFKKPMDQSFIGKPHEHTARRVYSTTATDYQERVNFPRMRAERLRRTKEMMAKYDLGALILFAGENIRYTTGSYQGNWKFNIYIRYCVVPREGDPVLFETVGSDMECAKIDLPWMKGNIRPAMTWRWAEDAEEYMCKKMVTSVYDVIKESGAEKERIGIDQVDMRAMELFKAKGLNLTSAWPCMSEARAIKTIDEVESIKITTAYADAAMWRAINQWCIPGVTEAYITAKVSEYLYENGFDCVYDVICASGGNTSPYRRWHTDKVIRQGDMVIIDMAGTGPGGYFVDFVRCWKVKGKPTQLEKDLYKECYDSLYTALNEFKPGNTTADVAAKFPVYDDDKYGSVSLQQFAHSVGLSLYEGMWVSRAYSLDYPMPIVENMVFAVETFAGHPKLEQTARLEEDIVITKDGFELLTRCPFEEDFLS